MKLNDEVTRLLVEEAIEAIKPIELAGTRKPPGTVRHPDVELLDAHGRIQRAMDSLGVARSRVKTMLKHSNDLVPEDAERLSIGDERDVK